MVERTGFDPNSSNGNYLSDISPKDKVWDKHRFHADKIRDLYEGTDYNSYAERISNCSAILGFEWIRNQENGEISLKLNACKFCRCRHCPVCCFRRQLMWRGRFFEALPKVQEHYPKARFVFLTLTIQNCHISELKNTVTIMNQAWKRLSQRKEFPALGYFRSLEVTRQYNCTNPECTRKALKTPCPSCTPTDYAHPHFHAILMVNQSYFKTGYVSHKKWVQMWKDCLRVDYDPLVNVKVVKSDSSNPTELSNDLMKGICETLKYSIKPEELIEDQDWLIQITQQLHKTRAIAVGGFLRKFISDKEPEDLINDGKEPEHDVGGKIHFAWKEYIARYLKIDLVA